MGLERLHIFEGEPYRIRGAVHQLVKSLDGRVLRFDRGETSAADLESMVAAVRGFSFGKPNVIVLQRPTADQGKAMVETLEKNMARCAAIVFTYEGEYADGRLGFVSAANKAGRLKTFDYVQEGDRQTLLRYLMEWKKGTGAKLTASGADWLVKNVPVLTAPVKSDKGKRDAQVYDIGLMFSELIKIGSWAIPQNHDIGPAELDEMSSFSKTFDVWAFCDGAMSGNATVLLEQVRRMNEQVKAGPWQSFKILQGQFALAESVQGLMAKNVHDAFEMQKRLDSGAYAAKFWHAGEDVVEKPAPINPYRIKKCIEACSGKPKGHFADRLEWIDSAQLDLRRGFPEDLIVDRLMIALILSSPYMPLFDANHA
jgi:hypothetical protein